MPKLFILLIAALLSFSGHTREQPKLGHNLGELSSPVDAPVFSLMDTDEFEYDFAEDKGKVVLINFWATWCPPCRREMPSMERLYKKYEDKGFTVLAINQMEDGDRIFNFTATLETSPTFPILLDSLSLVSQMYQVRGLPTTYLIDKKGRIRYRAIGGREFDHPDVEKVIESLLQEK